MLDIQAKGMRRENNLRIYHEYVRAEVFLHAIENQNCLHEILYQKTQYSGKCINSQILSQAIIHLI